MPAERGKRKLPFRQAREQARIRRRARGEWPEAVRALAGAWPDLPSAERIRKSEAKDVTRGRV